MNLNSDINRISRKINGYANNRFSLNDEEHVARWLDQFENNKNIIAHETANLLDKYYLDEERMRKGVGLFKEFIVNPKLN